VRRLAPGDHRFPHAGFETISVPHSLDRRPLVLVLLEAIKHLPQAERQAAADALQGLATQPLPGSLQVPLASFPEGDYHLEIKMMDKVSGKSVSRDVTFTVAPSAVQ